MSLIFTKSVSGLKYVGNRIFYYGNSIEIDGCFSADGHLLPMDKFEASGIEDPKVTKSPLGFYIGLKSYYNNVIGLF